VLERDLVRIERIYRARGFYEANVRAGRVERTKEGHVRVTIVVHEGPRVNVGEVRFENVATMPLDDSSVLFPAVRRDLRPGRAFDEDKFDDAKRKVLLALADRGYAFAKLKGTAEVDLGRHVADVTFVITPGNPARFGPVRITGLEIGRAS